MKGGGSWERQIKFYFTISILDVILISKHYFFHDLQRGETYTYVQNNFEIFFEI